MSDALTFLSAALDKSGWICVRGLAKGKPAIQTFFPPGDYAGAIAEATRLDGRDYNAYFSTSTFANKDSGEATNVNAVKVFKLDLDVKPDKLEKNYGTKKEAAQAVIDFMAEYGFPQPTMIDSGGGIHVYWIMNEALAPDDGKLYSEKLKAVVIRSGMKSDVTTTADVARILRVPGTHNHKNVVARQVVVKTPVVEYDTDLLCDLIDKAFATLPPSAVAAISMADSLLGGMPIPKHLQGAVLDKTTKGLMQGKPKSFRVLLDRSLNGEKGCAQIAYANDHQATIEEPRWRSALSVAWHCEDGAEAIHWLSRGHAEYDAAETVKKATLQAQKAGPHTCKQFSTSWPIECDGCPHKGKITSPIQLGEYVPKATSSDNLVMDMNKAIQDAPVVYEIPEFPFPYFRAKNGGVYMKDKDDDEDAIEICKQDFYMVDRLHDEGLGYLAHMRLHQGKDGVKDFLIPTDTVNSPAEFAKILNKAAMFVVDKGVHQVRSYVSRWFETLKQVREVSVVKTQFGWSKDFQSFVVGDNEILPGSTRYTPTAPSLARVVLATGHKGTMAEWRKAYNVYSMPGFEAHAFAALTGFGSPLLAFTNQDGVVLNAYSEDSGSGKSTTLLAACSIWGDPKGLWLAEDDTPLSRISRMGVYQHLPICVDEVTNMEEEEMSKFLFTVTRGKGRNRMSSSANEERTNNTSWKAIVLCSANTNFVQKLQADKTGVKGELMRLVEFDVPMSDNITKDADAIFGALNENYGFACVPFIQYVMNNLDTVKADIAEEMDYLTGACNMTNPERYWRAAGACIIVGGRISKELGLHDIDMDAIEKWFVQLVDKMRARHQYNVAKGHKHDLMGEFLHTFSGSILVLNVENVPGTTKPMYTLLQEPKTTKVVARFEKNREMIYIVRSDFNRFIREKRADGEAYLKELKMRGVLVDDEYMCRLGAGSNFPSTPVRCLQLKMPDDQMGVA